MQDGAKNRKRFTVTVYEYTIVRDAKVILLHVFHRRHQKPQILSIKIRKNQQIPNGCIVGCVGGGGWIAYG